MVYSTLICDEYHSQGTKVLFHSDGNLNLLLNGLVEAKINAVLDYPCS